MNLPIEFEVKIKNLLKNDYPLFRAEYERDAWQALRFNTLKKGLFSNNYKEIMAELGIRKIQPVPWADNAYYFVSSDASGCNDIESEENCGAFCRPGKDSYHEIGLYYIQEPSAMSAAGLLNVHPGERVLDLCAAPGGKSTQLAAALDGQGLLISNEINPSRAKILSQNIERMGITNAIVTSEDSSRLAERFGSYFHRILVDAPCSGEGMFRKNPDAMSEWSPQNVTLCAARQAEILDNAAQMLLPGGTLVYSTCTFSPEENEGTVGAFLERHPEFAVAEMVNRTANSTANLGNSTSVYEDTSNTMHIDYFAPGHPEWGNGNPALQQTHRLWPHKLHGEGHYAAVLVKAGQLPQSTPSAQSVPSETGYNEGQNPKSKRQHQKFGKHGSSSRSTNKQGSNVNMDKAQSSLLHEFLISTLSDQITHWIENGNLILFGDQLYRLPENAPSLDGLRVLRAGLHIGTFRKNRFEPSHALALVIGPEDVKQALSLSRGIETAKYLRGESLLVSDITAACKTQVSNGWVLICVESFSAGWGKVTGDIIKNHYPRGLRKTALS